MAPAAAGLGLWVDDQQVPAQTSGGAGGNAGPRPDLGRRTVEIGASVPRPMPRHDDPHLMATPWRDYYVD